MLIMNISSYMVFLFFLMIEKNDSLYYYPYFLTGMPPREIPGFFYDEEKKRYFAIPSSRDVADFHTSEVKRIRQKVEKNKRQKQLPRKLSRSQTVLSRFKIQQDAYFVHVERRWKLFQEAQTTSDTLKSLLVHQSNEIIMERPIQMSVPYDSIHIEGVLKFNGFRLVLESGMIAYTGCVFYQDTPNGILAKAYSHKGMLGVRGEGDEQECHLQYDNLEGLIERYKPTTNGKLLLLKNGIPSDREIQFYCDDFYIFNDYRKEALVQNSFSFTYESDVIAIDQNGGCRAYCCRNGNVFVQTGRKKPMKIEFGSAACGVKLVNTEYFLVCIVSGINNNLRSYKVNPELSTFSLYIIYEDYKWPVRVSSNLKGDTSMEHVFAVESQTEHSDKLELKFYDVHCPRPLKMISGPFFINNRSTSEYEWAIDGGSIFLFDKESQKLNIFKSSIELD